jgi:hypothetical protein
MIPHVPNHTIEHSAPCIELLTERWLLADKPQAGDLSIKNYLSNLKFFGITCELGSHQEYLDRRHRIDSIEIGGWAIVRASVRRRGAATVSEAAIPVAETISGCGARGRTCASGIGATKRRRLWRRC